MKRRETGGDTGATPVFPNSESVKDVPKYERCIVSLFDILGFKNLVGRSSVGEVLAVLKAKDGLRPSVVVPSTDGQWRDITKTMTMSFSDLIVNVTPLDTSRSFYQALDQLLLLGLKQSRLAAEGIFVRGGLTIGDAFAKEQVVFGPALIRAHELERTSARWPIVAIDPDAVNEMRAARPRFPSTEAGGRRSRRSLGRLYALEQIRELILAGDGETYLLDYIECFAQEDVTTGDLDHYLLDHRNSVMDAISRYPHWRYDFVARYHDSKCRK